MRYVPERPLLPLIGDILLSSIDNILDELIRLSAVSSSCVLTCGSLYSFASLLRLFVEVLLLE